MEYYGDIYDERWYRETDDDNYFALNPRYQEIIKLHDMLAKQHIPHVIRRVFDGWQVCYPNEGDWIMSAIEHRGSYGKDNDKLEIMGLLTPEEETYDSVAGYLTAEDVFKRVCEHYSQAKAISLPHTHTDPELNAHIDEIISDFRKVVEKAKSYGLDIKLTPFAQNSLELYFHDDYPDTILVDKSEYEVTRDW